MLYICNNASRSAHLGDGGPVGALQHQLAERACQACEALWQQQGRKLLGGDAQQLQAPQRAQLRDWRRDLQPKLPRRQERQAVRTTSTPSARCRVLQSRRVLAHALQHTSQTTCGEYTTSLYSFMVVLPPQGIAQAKLWRQGTW